MSPASKSQRVSPEYLDRGLTRLRAQLSAKGHRATPTREAVARSALQLPGPFRVEDLVLAMRSAGMPGSHFATVYRAMPLLVEAGLVRATPGAHGDSRRYEVAFEREQQPHLRCVSCGRMVEFQSRAIEALQRQISQRFGFELDVGASQLLGHCKTCEKAAIRGE